MKLPLAVGLLSLLPISVWAVPLTSGAGASLSAEAGAQRSPGGMVFGGFFTLYNFAVLSPLVPVEGPAVGSPYAQPMVDELDAAREPEVSPAILLIQPGAPALPVAETGTDLVPALPAQAIPGAARPFKPPLVPAANRLPEPSTLTLAALAALALATISGGFARPQPRNSRRRILPTGLFGRSSRNSTTLGRL